MYNCIQKLFSHDQCHWLVSSTHHPLRQRGWREEVRLPLWCRQEEWEERSLNEGHQEPLHVLHFGCFRRGDAAVVLNPGVPV